MRKGGEYPVGMRPTKGSLTYKITNSQFPWIDKREGKIKLSQMEYSQGGTPRLVYVGSIVKFNSQLARFARKLRSTKRDLQQATDRQYYETAKKIASGETKGLFRASDVQVGIGISAYNTSGLPTLDSRQYFASFLLDSGIPAVVRIAAATNRPDVEAVERILSGGTIMRGKYVRRK